jgi:DNA modification methylase
MYVVNSDALSFVSSFDDASVDLFLFDPPYYDIVTDAWDNQWTTLDEYVKWLTQIVSVCSNKLTSKGSIVFFGAIGKHGSHPLWRLCESIEQNTDLTYRNCITWKKRRAYGKSHDYLFCREEIVWYSKSNVRTEVTFNIPYLKTKRGYDGFDKNHPAKSEYKRVSNVWDDIPELMRPKRNTQKPLELLERLILTHSNVGDLVVDLFCGTCPTGIAAVKNDRCFVGCDLDETVIDAANAACAAAKIT